MTKKAVLGLVATRNCWSSCFSNKSCHTATVLAAVPGHENVAILNFFTRRAHSPRNGFQHIVLRLWSTADALTDADSVVRSTTLDRWCFQAAFVAYYRSRYFLLLRMIAETEMCTLQCVHFFCYKETTTLSRK